MCETRFAQMGVTILKRNILFQTLLLLQHGLLPLFVKAKWYLKADNMVALHLLSKSKALSIWARRSLTGFEGPSRPLG
ncbi:hypothetical protein VTL71DRAFT_7717 [Oculimacula yallundae]|uniref:Uncharacterized protein n=1 Tax=Oculimacula yallundae TaxID=86028 RepID=A0ABR4BWJ6_9HELO